MPSLPKKKRPVGRPKADHEHLVPVTFKADSRTLDALDRLQEAAGEVPGALESSRATVIRRVLQEAADRLPGRR